ncbi:MAG: VCBS repeat-containing protein [Phycisphaerae bacterium]|nr:VCBS repeat-containing protein [Phycisphaerae bacterium]
MKSVLLKSVGMGAAIALAILGCTSMYQGSGGGAGAGSGGGGTTDFLDSGQTASSLFRAIQVDPRSEDSAGPQVVRAADLDADGRLDLVSGWNESQPVQLHFQRRTTSGEVYFLTVPLGGSTPVARITSLEILDVDADGRLDIVVLVKDMGIAGYCDAKRPDCDPNDNNGIIDGAFMGEIVVFFAPADPLNSIWTPVELAASRLAGAGEQGGLPEIGGYTAMTVGDVDDDGDSDIVLAFNAAEPLLDATGSFEPSDQEPPGVVDIYPNPGGAAAREQGNWLRTTVHAGLVYQNLPESAVAIKDVKLLDVDRDGDLDIVCTYPEATSRNVRWLVNPLEIAVTPGDILRDWGEPSPIGQIQTGADILALGDVDRDGVTDVIVRSSEGLLVQWFKAPNLPSYSFLRTPWQVYTMAEFIDRAPGAVAVGDLDGDDVIEAVVGAEGALVWFDPGAGSRLFDQWNENLIIDDSPPETTDADATSGLTQDQLLQLLTDPQAQPEAETGTIINSVLIVDMDGDGDLDVVATLDRTGNSGLTNDALVWFRSGLATR